MASLEPCVALRGPLHVLTGPKPIHTSPIRMSLSSILLFAADRQRVLLAVGPFIGGQRHSPVPSAHSPSSGAVVSPSWTLTCSPGGRPSPQIFQFLIALQGPCGCRERSAGMTSARAARREAGQGNESGQERSLHGVPFSEGEIVEALGVP